MRKLILFAISAFAVLPALYASGQPSGQADAAERGGVVTDRPRKELKDVTFSVSMHCENCVKKIQENISFEKGVKALEVSLEDRTVKIRYDAAKTDEAALAAAIEKLGYEVKKICTE